MESVLLIADGASGYSDYDYDANGNMTKDLNRNILQIQYNYLNLPTFMGMGSSQGYIDLSYDALGTKLWKTHTVVGSNGLVGTTYSYYDDFVYLGSTLDQVRFDGGYSQATPSGTSNDNFAFYFYNRDHLGNVREVVDAGGSVCQVTNYYPFGTPYCDSVSVVNTDLQPYKYNGKELDKMHGLNTYDFGARQHDPILGRWDRMDPLCEKYYNISPYAYCHNNPINKIDIDGKADYFTTTGKFICSDNNPKNPYIYVLTNSGNTKLADYNFGSDRNGLKSMMRIAFHYGQSVGATKGGTSIGVDQGMSKDTDEKTLAYSTEDHHIRLMVKDGHFKDEMSQIYNMRSTLRHESIHDKGEAGNRDSEVKTLIAEINHPEFNKTTKSFQELTLTSLQRNLESLYEKDFNAYNKVINQARELLYQYGFNSVPQYYDGGNQISFNR